MKKRDELPVRSYASASSIAEHHDKEWKAFYIKKLQQGDFWYNLTLITSMLGIFLTLFFGLWLIALDDGNANDGYTIGFDDGKEVSRDCLDDIVGQMVASKNLQCLDDEHDRKACELYNDYYESCMQRGQLEKKIEFLKEGKRT